MKANLLRHNENRSTKGRLQFIRSCLEKGNVKRIKMAAHTGFEWFNNNKKRTLLKELAAQAINIQVIGNPKSPEMHRIMSALKDPEKEPDYLGANAALEKWHTYENTYPSIQLRVSDNYPMLHQVLIVEFQDGSSKAIIYDYAYGSPVTENSPCKQISDSDSDYCYYDKEFNFLWNASKTYEEWRKSVPDSEEMMKPSNYILMYPSHGLNFEEETSWIYSALSFEDNNVVTLRVNIPNIFDSTNNSLDCEYSYKGNVRVSGRNLFVSLYDDEYREEINISLIKPLHEKDRLIGIITRLDSQGNEPVAYKCACIGRSIISRIDKTVLKTLLCNNNRNWNDSLLVLENQDIVRFYSDNVLLDNSR